MSVDHLTSRRTFLGAAALTVAAAQFAEAGPATAGAAGGSAAATFANPRQIDAGLLNNRHVCPHAASCSMSEILSRGSTLVRADCARLRISSAAFTST
jgi:hypothetical protein